MIVWPGLRRFISTVQRLFNSASFYAPLTHSLVLDRGTGSPTFTRATAATVLGYGPTANSGDSQTLLTVAANEARFVGARRISEGVWSDTFADGTPIPSSTLLGYLAEGARTNHFIQSDTPATQTSGSLGTGTYTLWVDGSGSIAVAGATATITGAGTATSSSSVTFTVTVAGTVTYTVTGSPTRAQSENGAFRSSYIPTTTIAVARNADVLTYPSSGNIDGTKGWCYAEVTLNAINSSTNNWFVVRDNGYGILYSNGTDGKVVIFDGTVGAIKSGIGTFVNTTRKVASSWGGSTQTVTGSGLVPASAAFDGDFNITSTIGIGHNSTGDAWGCIRGVRIGQRKLSDSEEQAITA